MVKRKKKVTMPPSPCDTCPRDKVRGKCKHENGMPWCAEWQEWFEATWDAIRGSIKKGEEDE